MRSHSGRFLSNVLTAVALLCVTLTLAALFATEATAQQATAKIVGVVTDPQGAVVPGVKVTVTNTATNVTISTTTDKSGFYQVLNLPIGTYKVNAIQPGFRPLEVLTTPLEINQSFRVDMKLEVGATSEQVEVESQAAGVETVNPTLGESVTSRAVVNLPLNGRNVMSLALSQPGVTEDNPDDTSSTQGFNIGGGRTDSVTYLLDGGVNNDLLNNGLVFNPNPDAVAEFRILTSNYTAEYGRNGAGVISVVTKSGSNAFHGSAFEFVRNTDFDANSYFNNQAGLPRNNLKRNQYGGTFGGPIVKNRLFFFVAYQGQRQIQTEVLQAQQTFTTAELQNGDFSQAVANTVIPVDANGNPDAPISMFGYNALQACAVATGCPDPNVYQFLVANPYFASPSSTQAHPMINPATFDPGAQAYIATGLIPSNAAGLFFPAGSSVDNRNELTVKIDFNLSSKDKLTGTVGGNRAPLTSPFGGPGGSFSANTASGFPSVTKTNDSFVNIAYTRTFSPTKLNEFRVTAQRRAYQQSVPVANQPAIYPDFGIISDISNGPPVLVFDNGLTLGQDPYGPTFLIGNTFAYTDTFSWVQGHNTWKFGAGFSAYQQNTLYDFFGDSEFGFYGYSQGGVGTGNSLADFLVGSPNFVYEGSNAASSIRSKATYVFGQDEWRVRPNLTLSLGLRYEYSTPKLDTQGRSFSIIPGLQSVTYKYAPEGLVFPGDPGAPRGANFPDKTNFAPRIGFAFSPGSSSKTSIRGGFGIFYDVLKGEDNLQFNGAPPFYSEPSAGFACLQSANNPGCVPTPTGTGWPAVTAATGLCPAATTAGLPFYCQPWGVGVPNPFPSTPPDASTAFNPATGGQFLPFGGYESALFFVKPHLHTPYTYQYNLSVQHEVARNLIAEVNYVGSSAKGLTALQDIDPFDLSTLSTNPTRVLNEQPGIQGTFGGFCGTTPGSFAACPYAGDEPEFKNVAFSNFNSLEASLTKQNGENRIFGNTYFTLAFTYGHSLDDASGFRNRDSYVPAYETNIFYASSNFDVKERLTFSGGWDLPFDRAWAAGPNRLVKGWSLYPIFSWRTGFPLSISSGLSGADGSDPGPSGAGDGFLANADFAPGFSKITILNPKKNGNYYFNPAAFQPINDAYNPSDSYGTTGRDFFRGPGRTNLDLALAKATAITERINVELRLEAFNVLNHTEFSNPDTNIGAPSTFGQITTTTLGTGTNALQTQRIVQLGGRLTF
ncbi:MAG TPA: TonB-dependent receptor [Terriglobales bacterium]|jgi:hypothetical protein|nr:TonB-dependent receptor [Terriglobales bacterium]